MKEIKLTRGKFAIVDDEDYESLIKFNWYANKSHTRDNWYVVCSKMINGKGASIYMHRHIMGVVDRKVFIDHIDGNGLNCQKNNMRTASCSQNGMNRKQQKNSKSNYKGVSFHKGRWRATIVKDRKSKHIGNFNSQENAATAYNIFAEKYHGEFANYNKPI